MMQRQYYITDRSLRVEEVVQNMGFDSVDKCTKFLNHHGIMVDNGFAKIGREVVDNKPNYPDFPYVITPDNLSPTRTEWVELKRGDMNLLDVFTGKFKLLPDFQKIKKKDAVRSTNNYYPGSNHVNGLNSIGGNGFNGSNAAKGLNTQAMPFTPTSSNQNGFSFLQPTQQLAPLVPRPKFPSQSFTFTAPKPSAFIPATIPIPIPIPTQIPIIPVHIEYPKPKVIEQHASKHVTWNIPTAPISRTIEDSRANLSTQIPQTSPESKKKIYRKYSSGGRFAEFPHEILDLLITEEIHATTTEILSQTQTIEELSEDICEIIISDILKEWILERIEVSQTINIYKQAIEEMVDILINENVKDIATHSLNEAIEFKRHTKALMRLGIDRWKFFIHYKKFQKTRHRILSNQLITIIRQQSLKTSPQPINYQHQVADSVQGRLCALANEMYEKRKHWYTRLDFQNIISNIEGDFKILCYMINVEVNGSLEWFVRNWFEAKIGGDVAFESVNSEDERVRLVVRMCDTHGRKEMLSVGSTKNAVRSLGNTVENLSENKMMGGCASNGNVVNMIEKSFSTGLGAAIFHVGYLPNPFTTSQFWNNIRSNLANFITRIPPTAKIPLLVIYWPRKELGSLEFSQTFQGLVKNYQQFTTIKVLSLLLTSESFDSIKCTEDLTTEFTELLKHSPKSELVGNVMNCKYF
jgi:hypothetical protein